MSLHFFQPEKKSLIRKKSEQKFGQEAAKLYTTVRSHIVQPILQALLLTRTYTKCLFHIASYWSLM